MTKKVLFIAATHGDESIGPALLENLSDREDIQGLYESIIGNPRALSEGKRFLDVDLNRSAPGDSTSETYEMVRASELVASFKKFDYIIDLHETKANDRIVVIIPRLCRESFALALAFDIKEILIWPPSSPDVKTGPLVQYAEFGIEIESGTKSSSKETLGRLQKIVTSFLKEGVGRVARNLSSLDRGIESRDFYLVYGKINPADVADVDLRDFEEVDAGHERFTPLLFGKHQGLIGYKMRKIDGAHVLGFLSSL